MTFTKEWLQKAISDIETMRDEIPFGLDEDGNNTLAAFKTALSGMEADPVFKINHDSSLIKHVKKVVRETSSPQPLTTSERAELENYRNAQQVVPDAIEPDYEVIKAILPTANPDEYACCIAADMWNACRAAMLQGAEPVQAPTLLEWTNEQCLEFLSVAFRHNEISGDIEFDDIRLGVRFALAATPRQEVKK